MKTVSRKSIGRCRACGYNYFRKSDYKRHLTILRIGITRAPRENFYVVAGPVFKDVDRRYPNLPMSEDQIAEALTYYANVYGLHFKGRISRAYDLKMVRRLLDDGTPVIVHQRGKFHFVVAVVYNDDGELLAGTPLVDNPGGTFSPAILDSVIYLE